MRADLALLPPDESAGMRAFIRRAFLFLLLQTLVFSGLLVVRSFVDSGNYWGASIDKHERLAEAPSPRLVLIGGSGVALGIDSGELERLLDMNPVNMSLAAGLGPDFMLREVTGSLREGDVVVISLSYEALLTDVRNRSVLGLIHARPASLRFVKDKTELLVIFLGELGNELRGAARAAWSALVEMAGLREPTPTEQRWSRSSFNEYGDVIYERSHGEELLENYYLFPAAERGYPDSIITLLDEFGGFCDSLGVRAVLSYPAIPESTYLMNSETIEWLHARLTQELEMTIVNHPFDLAMPFELFTDTHYHLTRDGARERSRILAEGLLKAGVAARR